MIYRLKNSDFKPFLGIFGWEMSDLWVCMEEGIGMYFGIFCQGKVHPGVGRSVKKLFIGQIRKGKK
jgi:hypothetical protein